MSTSSLIEMTLFNSGPQHLLPHWLQISSPLPLLSSLVFSENMSSGFPLLQSKSSILSSASWENHTAAFYLSRWLPPFKPHQGVTGLCTSTSLWVFPALLPLHSIISLPTKTFGEVKSYTLELNSLVWISVVPLTPSGTLGKLLSSCASISSSTKWV